MSKPESDDTSRKPASTLPEQRNDTPKLNPAVDSVVGGGVARQIVSKSAYFSGPLPPPELLAAYEDVHPGLAERIVAMAEKEQTFGHEITRAALNAENDEHRRGQHYALIGSIGAFLCSFGLGVVGATAAASVVGGATVVGLVTAFILGRKLSDSPPVAEPQEEKPKSGPPAKRKK